MDGKKRMEILGMRRGRGVTWVCVSETGFLLTEAEAKELEAQGYGELRGGKQGVFWLYPKEREQIRDDT